MISYTNPICIVWDQQQKGLDDNLVDALPGDEVALGVRVAGEHCQDFRQFQLPGKKSLETGLLQDPRHLENMLNWAI